MPILAGEIMRLKMISSTTSLIIKRVTIRKVQILDDKNPWIRQKWWEDRNIRECVVAQHSTGKDVPWLLHQTYYDTKVLEDGLRKTKNMSVLLLYYILKISYYHTGNYVLKPTFLNLSTGSPANQGEEATLAKHVLLRTCESRLDKRQAATINAAKTLKKAMWEVVDRMSNEKNEWFRETSIFKILFVLLKI